MNRPAIDDVFKFDDAAWAAANLSMLNGIAVGFIVLGILVQAAASPDEEPKKESDEPKDETPVENEEHDHEHKEKSKKKPGRKKFRLFGKAA